MIEGVGLLPYSERLEALGLTTLIERRSRGDLIEVFKAKQGLSRINGILRYGRSGSNLISKSSKNRSRKLESVKRNFINERVKLFWNKLPSEVRNASSLNDFKSGVEKFKMDTISLGELESGNYWDLSYEVLKRIESANYLENKIRHNEYLTENPFVAKKKFINLF